jgi:hypothetical protein
MARQRLSDTEHAPAQDTRTPGGQISLFDGVLP